MNPFILTVFPFVKTCSHLLNQVTVIMDRGGKKPSAIPHHDWITLDYDIKDVDQVTDPDGPHNAGWGPINIQDRMDSETFNYVSRYFRPIRELPREVWRENLFSFAGVQGRRLPPSPGSRSRTEEHSGLPRYYVTFGGQASTAILDAIEIVESFGVMGVCQKVDREQIIQKLVESLPTEAHPNTIPMIWEQNAHFLASA